MTNSTCDVDDRYRSACEDLELYREHDGKQYCVLHFPREEKKEDFKKVIKECKLDKKNYDFRGTIFPGRTSVFQGYEFDADARFDGATFAGMTFFSDATFCGTAYFSYAQFTGDRANFSGTKFNGRASFQGAEFRGHAVFRIAKFSDVANFWTTQFYDSADFIGAEFSGDSTRFNQTKFGGETDFSNSEFRGSLTSFRWAEFTGITSFEDTTFSSAELDFDHTTFRNRVAFLGTSENLMFLSHGGVQFDHWRIDTPELITFNTVLLHPSWFINVDARRINFTDVWWYGMPGGPKGTLAREIDALRKRDVMSRHILLAQACRRLSANAEENREYPLANEFHYWSMDVLRKERWDYLIWIRTWIRKSGLRVGRRCGLATTLRLVWGRIRKRRHHSARSEFGLIDTLYWSLSGYGVRAARAFWVLIGMWAAFTTLYMVVDPSEFNDFGQGIGYLWQAAVYSLLAMARLDPEPAPEEPGLFQFLVGLEGILGPLQIALLALAIRRKVMR